MQALLDFYIVTFLDLRWNDRREKEKVSRDGLLWGYVSAGYGARQSCGHRMRRQQAAHSNSAWHLPRGDRTARTAASGRMTAPACCRHSRSRRELEVIAAATETPRGGERAHAVGAHVAEGHSLGGSGSAWAEISKPAGSRLPRRWIPRRRVVTCTLVRKTDNSYGDEHSITNTILLAS
jgi:hypothetical protein